MDTIEIRGLRVVAICGVLPEERERPQPLEVDLDVLVELADAGLTDDLADTVDYGALCDLVVGVTLAGQFRLLERLAEAIADAVLAGDSRITGTVTAVRKLRPPVPHAVKTTGVRIVRNRAEPAN